MRIKKMPLGPGSGRGHEATRGEEEVGLYEEEGGGTTWRGKIVQQDGRGERAYRSMDAKTISH